MSRIDLQPTLIGSTITLRPLAREDFRALYLAGSDPEVWELHPDSDRYKRDIFEQRFFNGALASGGALAAEANKTGRIVGSSRYYEWRPESREIKIGYTFIEPRYWGTGTNREIKDLMLQHIYQWASLVWFEVAEINTRSRRAVEKLGATLSHRSERELDGKRFIQLLYKLEAATFYARQATRGRGRQERVVSPPASD